jgi:cell division septation protein DedD/nucleoid DNA-binding protein
MVAVETVIRKLVSDYEFVIIPGFGALLSRQIPAIYDQDSGVYSPPVKKLGFNEFLKLDDGLLANYISREEKLTHVEAVKHVKQYTEWLRSALRSDGETKIEGIGAFRTNSEGKLIFEPDTENHFKDEWYGFQKVSAKTFRKNSVMTPVRQQDDVVENDVEVVEEKTVKVNWIRWASAAMLGGLMFYVSFFLVNANKEIIKSSMNPFDHFWNKDETTVLVQEESVKPVENIAPALPKAEVIERDSVITEAPETQAEPALEPSVVAEPLTEKKYYLIAGAFKGMRQANVLLEDLQKKGFANALVIPPGKHSRKVTVAVNGYDDEKEAHRESANLKKVIGEEGWVLKK